MRMIISAGGTGGHIYPALAIVNEFKKNDKDFEVLYIGTHNRMENDIVPKNNIPYESVEIYGFSKNIGKDIKNIRCIYKAYKKCLMIMKEFKPEIVLGVGGYVTFPVLMAARKLKIKTAIHEQNSIPGKTNKFLFKRVDKVFVSFKESMKYFKDQNKVVYSGNPCKDNVVNLKPITKESLGFTTNKKLILVTSGSLGSSGLNSKLIEFLHLCEKTDYEVLFLTGNANYNNFTTNNKCKDNIKIKPYLENLSAFFKSCDLVISRAGAGSISELIMAATPTILIPSPNVANNHQFYNALDVKNSGCGILIEEKDIDANKLFDTVNDLLNDKDKYNKMVNNMKSLQTGSSSLIIYNEVKELVNGN